MGISTWYNIPDIFATLKRLSHISRAFENMSSTAIAEDSKL